MPEGLPVEDPRATRSFCGAGLFVVRHMAAALRLAPPVSCVKINSFRIPFVVARSILTGLFLCPLPRPVPPFMCEFCSCRMVDLWAVPVQNLQIHENTRTVSLYALP